MSGSRSRGRATARAPSTRSRRDGPASSAKAAAYRRLSEHVAAGRLSVDRELVPLDEVAAAWERAGRLARAEARPRSRWEGALDGPPGRPARFAGARTSASCAARRATSTTSTRTERRTSRSCGARSRTRGSAPSSAPDGLEGVVAVISRPPTSRAGRAICRCRGSRAARSRARAIRCWPRRGALRRASRLPPCSPSSRALAEDAAELVEVDYEPLDPVLDARASERDDEPLAQGAAATSKLPSRRPRTWCGRATPCRGWRPCRWSHAGRSPRTTRRTTCSPSGSRRRTATASSPGWRTCSTGPRSRST